MMDFLVENFTNPRFMAMVFAAVAAIAVQYDELPIVGTVEEAQPREGTARDEFLFVASHGFAGSAEGEAAAPAAEEKEKKSPKAPEKP